VPTVADLRARGLEVTSSALRDQLVAGGFDEVRVVVESLAEEFDVLDVAAAAVKMAVLAAGEEGDEEEIADASRTREAPGAGPRRDRHERTGTGVRLFVGAGRSAGIRPADLVGAITGEAGVPSRALGAIEISDRFSLVEVPDELADDIVAAMSRASLRGKRVTVRRERG
jgi:ATP-dependent RNA helicase DeaD